MPEIKTIRFRILSLYNIAWYIFQARSLTRACGFGCGSLSWEHKMLIQCCFNAGQRLRRWANVETTLDRFLLTAGCSKTIPVSKHETFTQCWCDVGPSSLTLAQHYTSIGLTSQWPVQTQCHRFSKKIRPISSELREAAIRKSVRSLQAANRCRKFRFTVKMKMN